MTNEEALEVLREKYIGIGANDLFVFRKAAEALEKQIPKKVITKSEIAYCPHCGSKLTDTFFIGRGIHWCSICGNAIDWSDAE